jgi:Flp pilus assembly pilin Flp
MNIATKIINFIKDERGAEVTEFAVVTLVVAGGATATMQATRNKLADKNQDMLDAIDVPANAS